MFAGKITTCVFKMYFANPLLNMKIMGNLQKYGFIYMIALSLHVKRNNNERTSVLLL